MKDKPLSKPHKIHLTIFKNDIFVRILFIISAYNGVRNEGHSETTFRLFKKLVKALMEYV